MKKLFILSSFFVLGSMFAGGEREEVFVFQNGELVEFEEFTTESRQETPSPLKSGRATRIAKSLPEASPLLFAEDEPENIALPSNRVQALIDEAALLDLELTRPEIFSKAFKSKGRVQELKKEHTERRKDPDLSAQAAKVALARKLNAPTRKMEPKSVSRIKKESRRLKKNPDSD